MLDGVMLLWFLVTALSLLYVVIDMRVGTTRHAALTISLGDVCMSIERLRDGPVVQQVYAIPRGVVILRGRCPGRTPRLRVVVGWLMAGDLRKRDVPLMEQPPSIKRKTLTHR